MYASRVAKILIEKIIYVYQVSASIFAANSKEQVVEPENNKLLRCRECHVTVHASCYGITILPTDIRNWACDRCKAGRNDVVRVQQIYVFYCFRSYQTCVSSNSAMLSRN